jgi:hypothetical protein
MSQNSKELSLEEVLNKIEELENALRLEDEVLREMRKETPKERLGALKVMHHFAVLLAKKAIRDGATVH